MNVKDSHYKLQRLRMDMRSADLYQFQPKLRALADFLEKDPHCLNLSRELDDVHVVLDDWISSFQGNNLPNLNLSEVQLASLGFQAVARFKGQDAHSIIHITTHLTGERHLSSHVRAFYDTFVDPMCNWFEDKLSTLEKMELSLNTPEGFLEELISRGNALIAEAKFSESGGLLHSSKNVKIEWISDAKSFIEEIKGINSTVYKDFNSASSGVVYTLSPKNKEKNIEAFNAEMSRRLAYLKSLKKTLGRQFSSTIENVDVIPMEAIETKLLSIKSSKLREVIVRDIYDAQRCIEHSYKSAIILYGGAVEAILIYKLKQGKRKTKAIQSFNQEFPNSRNARNIEQWTFEQIIVIAYKVKLIDKGLSSNLSSLRDYRNFVHLYREIKSTSVPDEHLAQIAQSSTLHLLEVISKRK